MIKWAGNFLCEKGFFINLKRRVDRFEKCNEELKKAKIEGVERYDAVDQEEWHNFGCTQSHINIAKLQIENNWNYVLYLEDDIVLDVIYNYNISANGKKLNYNEIVKCLIEDMYVYKPDVLLLGIRLEQPVERKISNTLIVPNRFLMSHAYIGSLKYANFLVNNLKYKETNHFSSSYPIDWFLTQLKEKNCGQILDTKNYLNTEKIKNNDLLITVSAPHFFTQGKGLSDISGRVIDYQKWCSEAYSIYSRIEEFGISPLYL